MSCLDLDRITPTRRPEGVAPSGFQGWRNLLFVHYRYPAALVRELVPSELELDLWDGDAWVGIVPFEMQDIRLRFMPRRLGLDFLETNLRTYVHHRGAPGVYFFSLEASSRLAVRAARWGWGLPYHDATMCVVHDGANIDYASTRRTLKSAALRARWSIGEDLGTSPEGTLDFFLLERYLLFSRYRDRIHRGHVHHVAYPRKRVALDVIDDGLIEAAGLPRAKGAPAAVHFSAGVDVEVFGPWPES